MGIHKTGPTQLPQSSWSIELLQAINETAAYFQRSSHSEKAVFHAFREQLAKLKLRGGLSMMDESGKYLIVRVVNYDDRIGQILTRLETLVGTKIENHTFAITDVDVYRQVVETGCTQYIDDSSIVIAQMIPKIAQRYLGRIITVFGAKPAIYAPLITEGRVQGVMNIVGENILPDDVPVLTAFANHLAVALDNARLFEQISQHAANLEQRVAERTQELAAANERLTELDRIKSQLVSNVSHELRTPITNMELYLDLIKHGHPEKHDRYLKIIEEQSHRLKQLVEEILNLSRLEAGRSKLEFESVQLNRLIDQVVTVQQESALAKGIKLQFIPDEGLPQIQAISSQLSQVAENLIANSINYTSSGFVRVSTHQRRKSRRINLEVCDTGSGICPEDQPYIFDRFYRGCHDEHTKTPGSGLGLAIVKEIVDIHNGIIEFESKPGQGSTFKIWLPIKPQGS